MLAENVPKQAVTQWIAPTIVVLATCAAVFPVIWNDFVEWDDCENFDIQTHGLRKYYQSVAGNRSLRATKDNKFSPHFGRFARCRLQKPMQQFQRPLLDCGPMTASGISGGKHHVPIGQVPFVAFYEHFFVRVAGSPS